MSRVAVIQMVSSTDVSRNLKTAARLLANAAEQGALLAVLPENFALLDSPALRPLAEHEQQQQTIQRFLSEQARRLKLWIVAGSVPMINSDAGEVIAPRVRSACLVFDDQGQLQARYDKIHLFDVQVADEHGSYLESSIVEAGQALVVVDTPVGKLGLSICYDLRFPEMFQRLREMGAELISVPSAFTYVTGQLHWELLLRARAVETQCYILGADQGGVHSATRKTWGQSMLVDPAGRIMAEHGQGEKAIVADIELSALQKIRQSMPLLAHRKTAGF